MAGLQDLISLIYHEKQQEGSMLCAQHALNSLLQGNYFTAPDLSDIARNLDALEQSYDEDSASGSTNMDDTGFFSVQVLDSALRVWGLNLVRWRSERMRPYQDHPQTQLAFILNYQQHWFTIRRFGPAHSNVDEDLGGGYWFNLNSFLPGPEWVGKTYLGMVLQQAEADGYSVFVVAQADPSGPLALPRTEADQIAATLPEPSSVRSHATDTSISHAVSEASRKADLSEDLANLEEEDLELQAALQASLMNSMPSPEVGYPPLAPPPLTRSSIPLPSTGPSSASASGYHTPNQYPTSQSSTPPLPHPMGDADMDPVEASMERNRVILQRMKEQQEYAQRELWAQRGFGPEGPTRSREEEEEEEMLRRAIEESETLARIEGYGRPDVTESDGGSNPHIPTTSNSGSAAEENRVYDDDDAELQAALRESLQSLPEGWVPPELQPEPKAPSVSASEPRVDTTQITPSHSFKETCDTDDAESLFSEGTSHLSPSEASEVPEPVSMDELRRKRLARFGG